MSSSFRRASKPRQNESNKGTSPSLFAGKPSSSSPSILSTVLERVGTKPSKGGLTLTSSGLRDLDAIIGGGQPLGTAILIEEDRWTQDLALALTRYWSAEAVSQEQNLSIMATAPDFDISSLSLSSNFKDPYNEDSFNIQQHGMNPGAINAFVNVLPRNLHLDKFKNKTKAAENIPVSTPVNATLSAPTSIVTQGDFTIVEEDEDFEEEGDCDGTATTEEKGDEMLQNAWQYKVSVQRERRAEHLTSSQRSSKSGSKVYCHSYDLSGRMIDQHPENWRDNGSRISIVKCTCENVGGGVQLYNTCLQHIHETLNHFPNGVVRMLLMNAPTSTTSIALPLLLSYIRSHSLPVVILVTVRPWIQSQTHSRSPQSLVSLRRTCDAVFTCEGFDAIVTSPPPEFSDLAGIFSVRKMALQSPAHFADTTANRRPPANRFGMKRDRRKLHIRMLHLPPEDFSAGGSSVGGGVRSGAGRQSQQQSSNSTALQPGMGCASNMPGKASSQAALLDF